MQANDDQTSRKINEIMQCIRSSFPSLPFPQNLSVVTEAIGDAHGSERVRNVLKMGWPQLALADVRNCGPDLLFHISSEGLYYYLPAFLSLLSQHREFGWFEEALLPADSQLADVVQYFAGGALYGSRGATAERYFSRVRYLKDHLTAAQRNCVADYLSLATSYEVATPSCEFSEMLSRLVSYWKS